MSSKPRLSPAQELCIVIALCILSRLPQLLGHNLLLDGDEAIVGLMAKHLREGRGVPLFFWGQAYGFSLIECGICAAAFLIGGATDYSVKAAMLLLWTTGVVFLYKTFRREAGGRSLWPLLITLLFILSPAWSVWSMKARGGYLTAFAGSAVTLWLLLRGGDRYPAWRFFGVGLLLALVYVSQALWLAGLVPFAAHRLSQNFRLRGALSFLAGLLLVVLPLTYVQHTGAHYWQTKVFSVDGGTILGNARELPVHLFQSFSGYYYLQEIFPSPVISAALAWIMVGLIPVLIGCNIYKLAKKRMREDTLFMVSMLSVLLSLAYAFFLTGPFAPRYLLPLSGWMYVSLFFLLRNVRLGKTALAVIAALMLISAVGMFRFRDFRFQETGKEELLAAIDCLEGQGVRYVFVKNGLLQWQLMFYSREGIIARYTSPTDRHPEYVIMVNEALARRERVALIAYSVLSGLPQGTQVFRTAHLYMVIGPGRGLLEEQGFHF